MGEVLNIVKPLECGQTNFALPGELTATELSSMYLQALQFSENVLNS